MNELTAEQEGCLLDEAQEKYLDWKQAEQEGCFLEDEVKGKHLEDKQADVCFLCGGKGELVDVRLTDSPKDEVGYEEKVCLRCEELLIKGGLNE